MCYPKDRKKENTACQPKSNAKDEDVNWNRSKDLFNPRSMPNIDIENRNFRQANSEMHKRKWEIMADNKKVNSESFNKLKNPSQYSFTSLPRSKRNQTNSSTVLIEPDKMDERIKIIMNPFKVLATKPKTTTLLDVHGDKYRVKDKVFSGLNLKSSSTPPEEQSLPRTYSGFKNMGRTMSPKKLRLLKALLKRFRLRTSTEISKESKAAKHRSVSKTKRLPPSEQELIKSFLSLQDFDGIFTPSTIQYSETTNDLSEDALSYNLNKEPRISNSVNNMRFYFDSLSSFADSINEITTENFKSMLESEEDIEDISSALLNSLVKKKNARGKTKSEQSNPHIAPATPITLTLDEDSDDILISNRTRTLPLSAIGNYALKALRKSDSLKGDALIFENRNSGEHHKMDVDTTRRSLNDMYSFSSIPYMLRAFKLLEPYTNSPMLFKVPERRTSEGSERKPSVGLHPVGKENTGKKFSKNNVDYNGQNENSSEPSIKFLSIEDLSKAISSVLRLQDEESNASISLPMFDRVKTVNLPNINLHFYNISSTDNTSRNIRKIWNSNELFYKNLSNPLYQIKRIMNGTDEFLAVPVEAFLNEFHHFSRCHGDEFDEEKDHIIYDQLRMMSDKSAYDRCDFEESKCRKPTTKHHRKVHPTRFGMHIEAMNICSKCTTCSTDTESTQGGSFSCIFQENVPNFVGNKSEPDYLKWKCTCKKFIQENEHIQPDTDRCLHVPSTKPTNHYTMKLYDEEDSGAECEKNYTSDFEQNRIESNTEDLTGTPRTIKAPDHWHFMSSCNCNKGSPNMKEPSRSDMMVSCGGDKYPKCTVSPSGDEEDFIPEKFKKNYNCIGCSHKEITRPPPELRYGGTTGYCKHQEPISSTRSALCPHRIKTKRRLCTCACLCGPNKNCHVSAKTQCTKKHATKCSKHHYFHPNRIQNSLLLRVKDAEKALHTTQESSELYEMFTCSAIEATSPAFYHPTETYYTVSDIDLNKYFPRTTFLAAADVTEEAEDIDTDYWISEKDSNTETSEISPLINTDSNESATDITCDYPIIFIDNTETTRSCILTASTRRRCSCSQKNRNNINNPLPLTTFIYDIFFEETGDNYDKINSKYVAKYKTYGLDSPEVTYGMNREGYIGENIIPGYKQVTRSNRRTENTTPGSGIKIVTPVFDELDIYSTQIKTVLDDESVSSTETTPHSLLSPGELITLSTATVRSHNHNKIRAFLASNNVRKPLLKNKPLKANFHTTNQVINPKGRKKSSTSKLMATQTFVEKLNTKNYLANQADGDIVNLNRKKNLGVTINTTPGEEPIAENESESISLPKEIVKNSEIASVKIVFGANNYNHVKRKKKKRFNEKKKFFSFDLQL